MKGGEYDEKLEETAQFGAGGLYAAGTVPAGGGCVCYCDTYRHGGRTADIGTSFPVPATGDLAFNG